MLDLATAIWLGVIGACIGSFLNVVAYRMPRGMSVVWKPSHCPQCGHAIRARDNVPVLGWLLLRGRCRDCRAPISPRYPIVEALMGAAFVVLAYAELFTGGANSPAGRLYETAGAWDNFWNGPWRLIGMFAFHALLLSLLMAMALIDLDGQRVPAGLPAFAAIVASIAAWNWPMWYPERMRIAYAPLLKAPLDALYGAAWGAAPWLAAYVVYARRGGGRFANTVLNTAAALGAIGACLGLHAVVRITFAHLIVACAARLAPERFRRRPLALAPLWPITLVFIAFWKQLAPLLNW